MSDCLRCHELYNARLPCPSLFKFAQIWFTYWRNSQKYTLFYIITLIRNKAAQENFWCISRSFPLQTHQCYCLMPLIAIAQRSLNGYATESTKCTNSPNACGFIFILWFLKMCIWFLEFKWSVEPDHNRIRKSWLFLSRFLI